ncbi:hypothetical protein AWV79_34750 [Cupriavidus sp. UYMMa02A]|nr:hypothetical protein AWV79_34750 [Cupriavidus sp. UYMMa02A]
MVSSACGLKMQVVNGLNGVVLDEPNIETKAAETMHRLAANYSQFDEISRAAHMSCRSSSTQIAQLPRWCKSIQLALSSFAATQCAEPFKPKSPERVAEESGTEVRTVKDLPLDLDAKRSIA